MTINSLEDLVDQQAERIKELEGADAMLREIEKIIPRNDAHRDYAETVQLFVEQSSRTASACEIFKENSSHCAEEFEAKLAAQKRIKELEEIARKWELAAKIARTKLETFGGLFSRKPTESVEMVVERTNARIKELEGLLTPLAETVHRLIQQNMERIISEANALGADKCSPAPHACSICEIRYLAEELLQKVKQ